MKASTKKQDFKNIPIACIAGSVQYLSRYVPECAQSDLLLSAQNNWRKKPL